jgi:hypothetical protein
VSRTRLASLALALAFAAAGCATSVAATDSTAARAVPADGGGTVVTVHRTETCGCCGEYEDHLREHGFEVVVELHDDATTLQDELGVPERLRSCHVNQVDGYLAVGHVPAAALLDLGTERPAITGIALAGMPLGAPGMPGEPEGPFVVERFDGGEVTGTFGTYGG